MLTTAKTECDKFPGRLKDLCLGVGLDGRPNPTIDQANAFRHQNSLTPLERPQPRPATPAPDGISWFWKGVNFGSAIMKWLAAGRPVRKRKEIKRIFAICHDCNQFDGNRCLQCSCACNEREILMNKIALETEHCPLEKW